MLTDLGLLVLRLVVGGLLGGHGSQKLFGWFGGYGIDGTAGWLESIGLKPGRFWAAGASTSEFGGGALTALGFLHPIGPIATMAAMVMATAKAHWGKPIWVAGGGAELPVTNIAAALALALTGPGRFSVDSLFGIRLPRALVAVVIIAEAVLVAIGVSSQPAKPTATEEHASAKVEGGQGADSL